MIDKNKLPSVNYRRPLPNDQFVVKVLDDGFSGWYQCETISGEKLSIDFMSGASVSKWRMKRLKGNTYYIWGFWHDYNRFVVDEGIKKL